MWPNPQIPADLVTFTEEILNGKLDFFVQWVMLVLILIDVEHLFLTLKKVRIVKVSSDSHQSIKKSSSKTSNFPLPLNSIWKILLRLYNLGISMICDCM